ncbi:MAG: MBL fold metallo-hydrolase [Candidatus Hydrothermarchaeales archaeon]
MNGITPIMSSGTDCNAYLIQDAKKVLIDAGAGLDDRIAREVGKALKGEQLDMIINTHAHFDHCGGDGQFNEVRVYLHRDDANALVSGSFYGTYRLFDDERPTKFHRLLVEGDKLELGEHILEVVHSPGHTPGSICLFDRDRKMLFSGDTLFSDGGFGRVDIGGNGRQMLRSLEKLSEMSFDTLYPGHGPIAMNGREQAEISLRNARELLQGELD